MAAALPEEVFWMICRKPTHPNATPRPTQVFRTYLAAQHAAIEMTAKTGAEFGILTFTDVFRPTDRPPDDRLL